MSVFFLDNDFSNFFPDPRLSDSNGLVAVSRNLGNDRLIAAYRQGIFPWMKMKKPPHFWCWYSPDPRMVLYPERFRMSRSLKKAWVGNRFEIRTDQAFEEVMRACALAKRPGQESTWIESEMISEYGQLHQKGIAHSIEAYQEGKLVGGLYGLAIGKVFFGESMFHRKPEASKACMAKLVEIARIGGLNFIDCQVPSPFLGNLGAEEVERNEFLEQLGDACMDLSCFVDWSK